MVYSWKSGARMSGVSAQLAGEVCESLDAIGCLSAQRLVDVSRPNDAPLHGAFEWDDAIAGEEWRKNQARLIIRSIVVVPDVQKKEVVRAFFKVEQADGSFESLHTILKNEDKRNSLMRNALSELEAFKRKYSILEELAAVFDAIDSATEKVKSEVC